MAVTERAAATLEMILRALRTERRSTKVRAATSSIPPINVFVVRSSSAVN